MPVTSYSRTPADNNAAPPNGFPEGQTPASLNDSMRQVLTDIVNEATKGQATVLASVSGTNTITATMTPDLDAYTAGMVVKFTPAGDNTGAATLNIDSLGALDIQKYDGEALAAGDLKSGVPAVLILDSGADDWYLLNPQSQRTTSPNVSAEEFGFKGIPQNPQSGDYTLVLTDAGKSIYDTGTGSRTYTIPANSSVAFPVGTAITLINFGTGNRTIAITTDTLYLSGTGTTGSRTLAQYGIATVIKITSTAWMVSGTGLV